MGKNYTLPRKRADKHLLYELSVQEPAFEVEFAVQQYKKRRGKRPRMLREDFCGTAAIACRWVQEHPKFHAIGLDLDAPILDWAHRHNVARLGAARERIDLRHKDVRTVTSPKADVIQAFNFSSYLFYPLPELLKYFRCVRRSLAPGGIFMLDGYGGWESQQRMSERRKETQPGRHIWIRLGASRLQPDRQPGALPHPLRVQERQEVEAGVHLRLAGLLTGRGVRCACGNWISEHPRILGLRG